MGNAPPGSRVRVGTVLLEVTAKPHNGCRKFQQRFGADALRFTAHPRLREHRIRGIYARVLERGEAVLKDRVEVVSRS